MLLDRLFQGRRLTRTQSSVKAFLKAGYAQMNDWSRLAVAQRIQKIAAGKRTATNRNYVPEEVNRVRHYREALKSGLTEPPSGEGARTTPFALDKYLS